MLSLSIGSCPSERCKITTGTGLELSHKHPSRSSNKDRCVRSFVSPSLLSPRSFRFNYRGNHNRYKDKLLSNNGNVKSYLFVIIHLIHSLAMLKRQACRLTRARMAGSVEGHK